MSDVFISYSRKNKEFVHSLNTALTSEKRDVWVDWEDIPPTAEWLAEIFQAIDATDTFVFVISPDSIASKTCGRELDHALNQNKRIVPLLLQDVDPTITPEPLGKLNWIMFRAKDDFDAGIKALNYALELDLDWVKAHTRLLVRAREWDAKGRNHSYLLIDADLEEAQGWLSQAGNKKPSVTQLQVAYVAASQQGMIDRQQKQLRGFYLVSIIYGVLQWTVSYLVVFNEITETGLVFLSPIWLLGLVFGISGLTVGRTSLKRALILTVASAILLYLFFIVIWPLL